METTGRHVWEVLVSAGEMFRRYGMSFGSCCRKLVDRFWEVVGCRQISKKPTTKVMFYTCSNIRSATAEFRHAIRTKLLL